MKDYLSKFSLKGKTAYVVGGAGLIGGEVAKSVASAGANAIILDIDEKKSLKLVKAIRKNGNKSEFEKFDISKVEFFEDRFDCLIKKYGAIDIWINVAYPRTEDWGKENINMNIYSWRKNIDMHLNGYLLCCQKVAECMKGKKGGIIINFSSIYGIVGPDFSIYEATNIKIPAAYSAIKGGIVNFSRYLASYYGKYNIRVNSISPGGVLDKQPVEFIERYSKKTPLGRMANKEDIAGAVIYLASDAGAYVSGHNLVVDGGWSII